MEPSTMSSESMDADRRQILDAITKMIFAVADHIPPSQKIDMGSMLVADLGLQSIELANLIFRLNAHYSGSVSLGDFVVEVAGNDMLSDLPVGGIVDFVANSLGAHP
jgi:hypothetical protein